MQTETHVHFSILETADAKPRELKWAAHCIRRHTQNSNNRTESSWSTLLRDKSLRSFYQLPVMHFSMLRALGAVIATGQFPKSILGTDTFHSTVPVVAMARLLYGGRPLWNWFVKSMRCTERPMLSWNSSARFCCKKVVLAIFCNTVLYCYTLLQHCNSIAKILQ